MAILHIDGPFSTQEVDLSSPEQMMDIKESCAFFAHNPENFDEAMQGFLATVGGSRANCWIEWTDPKNKAPEIEAIKAAAKVAFDAFLKEVG